MLLQVGLKEMNMISPAPAEVRWRDSCIEIYVLDEKTKLCYPNGTVMFLGFTSLRKETLNLLRSEHHEEKALSREKSREACDDGNSAHENIVIIIITRRRHG